MQLTQLDWRKRKSWGRGPNVNDAHLVQEVADVVIAEPLGLQQLVQVGLHQTLNDVDILHVLLAGGAQDVPDVDHVLVVEPQNEV